MASADSDGKGNRRKEKQTTGNGAQNHRDPDEDQETFWESEESFTKRNDHLDDGDLEYINAILNSFSRDRGTHTNSNNSKLESFTPEDALACALASPTTPSEFNLKFNQNPMTRGSREDHFSYFSNVEEDGTSELGDYFSDDEENDTWDSEDLTSESNPWSHTNFNDSEPNFSEWDPVVSGLETLSEARFEDNSEADKLNHISAFQKKHHSLSQHGNRLFLQNLSSKTVLLTRSRGTFYHRHPHHRSLPSSRSQRSPPQTNQQHHQ
jgi:hypothetical protein